MEMIFIIFTKPHLKMRKNENYFQNLAKSHERRQKFEQDFTSGTAPIQRYGKV